MKFRGKITDLMCIRQFTQLINSVSRLAKVCVLRLTSYRVCLVVSEGGALGGTPGLWAELEQKHYFAEYTMEGVSQEDNQIFMELQTDKLAKTLNSLRSTQSAKSLKIKLTKKLAPCLTFEVELPSLSGRPRLVVHDVPVTLIPRRLWTVHQEPRMTDHFDASLYLPPLKQLRHVVERMKSLSSHVTLAASRAGSLVVSVNSTSVTAATHFNNLATPVWEGEGERDEGAQDTLHSATVDIKKLAAFLQGEHSAPSKVICNVVAGRVVHLFLLQDNITLQYFLPAVTPP